jgi:hypothetical protein
MLDLYPAHEFSSQAELNQDTFRQLHRWFEVDAIQKMSIPDGLDNKLSEPTLPLHYGGVRARIFQVSPLISKLSLMKPNLWLCLVGAHLVSRGTIADITCVLYYYKFLPDFAQKVDRVVQEGQYYQGSAEYKQYQKN